jgi:hypothetical protein
MTLHIIVDSIFISISSIGKPNYRSSDNIFDLWNLLDIFEDFFDSLNCRDILNQSENLCHIAVQRLQFEFVVVESSHMVFYWCRCWPFCCPRLSCSPRLSGGPRLFSGPRLFGRGRMR